VCVCVLCSCVCVCVCVLFCVLCVSHSYMSLEPTQDAWDGTLWEQEQPIAYLLERDIEYLRTKAQAEAQAQLYSDDTKPANDPQPMSTDATQEIDIIPKPEPKPTGKKNRVLKKHKTAPSKELQRLMEAEKAARYELTREERVATDYIGYHRRDDRELWQLLERQRKRSEARVTRRIRRYDEEMLIPPPPELVRHVVAIRSNTTI